MTTRRNDGGGLDWTALRERLERVHAATAATVELSPERARAVMEERARLLARAPDDAPAAGEVLEILAFALGSERYAVGTRYVREVVRLVDFTPVPGAPEFVLGVTNLRGAILAITDLRRFFGVPQTGLTDLSRVIVLGGARAEIGVLADEAPELRALPAAEILEPPESVGGIGREYLLGVTEDALIVLDAARLLADPRLFAGHAEAESA
ncbi:MAG: chemotaxis protein CheW [Candidatus Binatia bacterium]